MKVLIQSQLIINIWFVGRGLCWGGLAVRDVSLFRKLPGPSEEPIGQMRAPIPTHVRSPDIRKQQQ